MKETLKYKKHPKDEKAKPSILVGSKLEAESLYISSQFPDSFIFPYNPDPLVDGNDYRIYDEMKDDDQIKVAMSIKKSIAINPGWEIVCEDKEIKDFITTNLSTIHNELEGLDSSFSPDVLRDMLSSFEYGFSLTEPVSILGKDGFWRYRCLKTRPPHSFRFHINDKGIVQTIFQYGHTEDKPFKPSKFLHHVYQSEFGNPYGKSDFKAAHPAWAAKRHVQKFLNIYLERYASPTAVGQYPTGMDADEIKRFHDMIKTIQNATSLAIPDDTKLDFVLTARDATDAYIKALHYYNMMISRSLLIPDLIGVGGSETKGGSFALGKEQFKLLLRIIDTDRKSLAEKITLKLVRPLVKVNWGDIPCFFQFLPYTEEMILEFFKIWNEAVQGGSVIPTIDDAAHIRKSLGFPEPKTDSDKGATDSDEAETKENIKKFAHRPLSPFEKKVDFQRMKKALDRSEAEVTPKLKSAATKIFENIIDQIEKKKILSKFKPEKLNEIEPHFLREMNAVFKSQFKDLFKESTAMAKKEIFPQADFVADKALPPQQFLDIIEAESFKMVGDYSLLVTKKAKDLIVEGLKTGESQGQIVKQIRNTLTKETDAWLNTAVRTKTTAIFNDARRSFFENDSIASQIVDAYEFSAILDARTSDICRSLDGKIFEVGKDANIITPPVHFNCRSVLVPITRFEDFTVDKLPSAKELKDMGGTLAAQRAGATVARKFATMDNAGNLIASGKVDDFGDISVIGPPGPGRHIVLMGLVVSNTSMLHPVLVGWRFDVEKEIQHRTMLIPRGGRFEKSYRNKEGSLPENMPLFINLSSPIDVEYTVEYMILDKDGSRVA